MGGEVFESVENDGFTGVFFGFKFYFGGRGGQRRAEEDFSSDGVNGGRPRKRGGVASEKDRRVGERCAFFGGGFLESREVFGEPSEVFPRIVHHAFREVGAHDTVAHEQGFLEDDTCATEGVEDAGVFGERAAEIEEDLGEFWRKHADFGVAGGASLVALGIEGDVLDGEKAESPDVGEHNFDMIFLFCKLIVVGSGG